TTSLRFVRRAGQDRVYRVALSTDLFTSKFQDWIDPDLLGIKAHWDITDVKVRDYDLEDHDGRVAVAHKNDFDLEYNDQKAAWSAKQMTDYKNDKPVESKLAADEEVDATKLNDAKTALSGLKIVDIYRKPAPLAEELKKNKDFISDADARKALGQFGFLAVPSGKSGDVFGGGGDMTVSMKDGVEYTIRFGGVDLTLKDKEEGKKSDKAADAKRADAQRIVFVTARFNEDLLTKPKLEPLPEAKKPDAAKPGEQKPGDTKPEAKAPEAKSSEAKTPDATKPANSKPADAKTPAPPPDKKPGADAKPPMKPSAAIRRAADFTLAMADPADAALSKSVGAKDTASKATAETTTDSKKVTDQKADDKSSDAKPANSTKPAADTKADGKTDAPAGKPASDIKRADEENAADAERKRIEAENKKKTDDYAESVKKGKEKVKQLNDRFADWFYLISQDDYKKVHITRADVIKKKAAAPDTTGLPPVPTDPFNKK
ncbi:MAG TPA: hypothetical protein VKB78_11145, partial [Pirellulales bacterium]|nr:hypothetical protein [Pirellulales bacterium]